MTTKEIFWSALTDYRTAEAIVLVATAAAEENSVHEPKVELAQRVKVSRDMVYAGFALALIGIIAAGVAGGFHIYSAMGVGIGVAVAGIILLAIGSTRLYRSAEEIAGGALRIA